MCIPGQSSLYARYWSRKGPCTSLSYPRSPADRRDHLLERPPAARQSLARPSYADQPRHFYFFVNGDGEVAVLREGPFLVKRAAQHATVERTVTTVRSRPEGAVVQLLPKMQQDTLVARPPPARADPE